jgi:hypothetical protein
VASTAGRRRSRAPRDRHPAQRAGSNGSGLVLRIRRPGSGVAALSSLASLAIDSRTDQVGVDKVGRVRYRK